MGLTVDELAEVAQTNTSRKVTVLRDLSENQFLEHLRRSNDPGRRYIVNFDRAQIDRVLESIMKDDDVYGVTVKLSDLHESIQGRARDAHCSHRAAARAALLAG